MGAPLKPDQPDSPWPCDAKEKYICHFPETREIWSYGSGYGGNALLGKKCHALRIASYRRAMRDGLAEHHVDPEAHQPVRRSEISLRALSRRRAARPNLAMLIPTIPGWKVETVGDDIAWMKFGADGRLYAINPEYGFFGVAPGTQHEIERKRNADCDRRIPFLPTAP